MNSKPIPPERFLLLSYGIHRATHGKHVSQFVFNADDAQKIVDEFTLRGKELVIDYEHQTLSGGHAPAAGWIGRLERAENGLYVHVQSWTEKAVHFLRERAYRYFSPVLMMSDGHPVSLHSVALTNHPAIHALEPLVASDGGTQPLIPNPGVPMLNPLQRFAEMLSVPTLGEDSVLVPETELADTVASTLQNHLQRLSTLDVFLKEEGCPDLDALKLKLKGMVNAGTLNEIQCKCRRYEAERAVEKAFSSGKLTESQRDWAKIYAEKNLEAFNDFIAHAPIVSPGKAPELSANSIPKRVALSDEEFRILRISGCSEDQIKRYTQGE